MFAGFVPIGTIGAVLSSGAALTAGLIRSLDDFFETTKIGVSALYDKAGSTTTVDPNLAKAMNDDLAALRIEWKQIRREFGKEATELKQHGERVRNWFKAFMNFTLKLQAVYIGTKRLAFTAAEARRWKELEQREAAQILGILQEHLNVVEIVGGLTVPTSRKFSPNGVVKRIARVLTAKEELAA